MPRQPVISSNLRSVGYDWWTSTLEIEFHRGGIYDYFNVPEPEYDGLMNARSHNDSHGRYFHARIKYRYAWRRIQ